MLAIFAWVNATRSEAAVVCPNPVAIVNENQCKTGSSAWEVNNYSPKLGGFTTQTSVNVGENMTLKVGYNGAVSPSRTATITTYRMGYYGGTGGRLVNTATNVPVNNDFVCEKMDEVTGKVSCANWQPTYTIPGSALAVSGVYLAKVVLNSGEQTQVVFTVREDSSHSKMLLVLPIADYEAYNTFGGVWNGEEGGKSLYYGTRGYSTGPVTGASRAAKVSFDRPFAQVGAQQNWFVGPDFELIYWLEKQGYEISYTDDVSVSQNPSQLLNHETDLVSGHSEYWSLQQFNGFLGAREAGINIASFSANTAYWKVRYEDNGRTLVCYKTVEGSGSAGTGTVSQNDWGPDGIKGTSDDALGKDGIAGTADDNPQNATTTFRDNGAPNGDPAAPPGGRVGPDMPENELFGVMYVGDNDSHNFQLEIPAANAAGENAGSRFWRNTGISENSKTTIPSNIVGWEWDAVPTQAQYSKYEPSGVEHLFETNVQTVSNNSWLQDEGRLRNTSPPPGQPGTVGAVKYTAASGAEVFASGTMLWARGLTAENDPRIEQATYNVLSEMGNQPNTPEESLTLDPGGSNHAPSASFTISQNPAKTATALTFDASASKDSDGSIAKYEWDLDGNGSFETTTTTPKVTHSYAEEGTYNVRLRVVDNGGATSLAVKTLQIINNQPPTASFTFSPETGVKGQAITFNGSGSSDPDGTIAKYEWDFDGDGSYETSSGASATTTHTYSAKGLYDVGLRVTDNGGKTSTTTRAVSVGSGEASQYSPSILGTPGLAHYWRLGESAGPTFSDSKGSSPATASAAGVAYGTPGAIKEDPDKAATFDGTSGAAKANVNLSNTHTVTVEFWLNWETFANNDSLAMEFTPNFNENAGGFLVDPNAPQGGGTFGVGIGSGASRNNVYFSRPSAGEWHYYAFVFNTAKPAAEQITPYVDGKPVSFTKEASGTGAGNFANSVLNFMSRGSQGLFGKGSLDEVAIYERALTAATIAKHYEGNLVSGTEGSEGSGGTEGGGGGEPPKEEEPPTGGTGAGYVDSVLATPGITDFYPLSEATGPTVADPVGGNPLTAVGTPTFGAAGGVPGDTASSVKFNGVSDAATGPLHLGGQTVLTVEFWMKWNAWANNDELAMEYTPNFNSNPGGFLVDPNSSYGKFAVSLGIGSSRNVALFERPSAGAWHHYAFVLDSAAAGPNQITPYVDGVPVTYTKAANGEGGPTFADSTLALMSRNGKELFGAGNLQDIAIYNRALSAATVSSHYASNGTSGRPQAIFSGPATAKVGEKATFDASASKDPDGTIAKYEWDLDGNGSFETSTGTTPTVSSTFTSAGKVSVGLRVTDNSGNTATATRSITVEGTGTGGGGGETAPAHYSAAVLGTPGLLDYWPLSETSGSVFADSAGTSPATMAGGPTLGVTGGAPGDSGTAARFDGIDDAASAPLQLGGKTVITLEFWLKWNAWSNNDALAFEYTPNFNDNAGGFLVDPNSSYGSFAVALGQGASRNVALFERPSAGVWHHYAFVLDTTAAASEEIVPYVDGKAIAYTKAVNGSGAPAFANAALSFMSRAGTALNGAGDLQDVAVYDRPLSASQVASHYAGTSTNAPPTAAISGPATAKVGEAVTFDASGSKDSDGTVEHYEWDLDGDGSFETSTGATAKVTRSFATAGPVNVSVRVTDNSGATAVASRSITIQSTGTGGEGGTGTTGSGAAYRSAVLATPSVLDFWSLGEKSGSVFADSVGGASASMLGAPTLGTPGAIAGDSDTSASFNGVKDAATAPLTLGNRTAITLEFWLKWNEWSNNDALAFEYTPNFNENAGGFLVDPNSSYGSFAVGIGRGASRNVSIFARPSAGVWHNYAFVLNTEAPASEQIVPYVDGKPVTYTKAESGTGAGNFADAALSFMSRAGTALNGAGSLDDVSIYGAALSPSTVAAHYEAATPNKPPTASFTTSPNPVNTKTAVTFNASASKDSDGTIAKYEWDLDGNGTYETDTGTNSTTSTSYATAGERTIGLRVTDDRGATATTTSTVTVKNQAPTASFTATPSTTPSGSAVAFDASASSDPDGTIAKYEWDLDGNGTYETDTGTNSTATTSYATPGSRTVGLRVTDDGGATATTTRTVTIQNRAPLASFTATPNPTAANQAVSFDASASSDPDGTIAKYEWDLNGDGVYETNTGTTPKATTTYTTSGERTVSLRVTDNSGATTVATQALVVSNQAPTASFAASPASAATGTTVSFNASASKDSDGTIAKYEWDLDGNGTYETTTTTPTTTTSYATPGVRSVGLRVVDNLGAATVAKTVSVTATNRAPTASFTATPNPVPTGTAVSYNASASSDPDGTIAKYEWDLDGNGTYETTTTTPTTSSTYATPGARTIRLRVTDNSGAQALASTTVTAQNRAPIASFTATPNPVTAGTSVAFSAAGSSDPDGTIAKYEWDLDGNGTYETNTGTTNKTSRTYTTAATVNVGLKVTDNSGASTATTVPVTVRSPYNAAVLGTAGLTDYWRLGETSGTTFVDSVGGANATAFNGVSLNQSHPLTADTNTAATFDGTNDYASAPLNLSGTSKLTVEFWLRWNVNFANNDSQVLELTNNFNNTDGGFLVNPNSSTSGGRFEVAIGRGASRNNIYFTRPTAGAWHHYAFVIESTAAASNQILAYVDGKAVATVKGSSGTGAGNFANSTLYFMSRGGTSLFAPGTLDELAIYNTALTAAQISAHYAAR